MSSDAIRNWDKILHKNVRSKDMDGVGNVIAINDDDDDSISITTQGSQHIYKIPKSHIEGYNGAEVFLDLAAADMSKYDINSKSQDNIEDTITTISSTTTSTKSVTETLSRPTLPRTQVKTSTSSITEKRTESTTTDLASSHRPVITDNKSSSPTSNEALKAKRKEAEDKARREAEAIEHATITTTKESFETPLPSPTPSPPQQQAIIEEKNLTTSTENTTINYLRKDKDPLAANMTSWQYPTVAWIDMYKQFAINAAKLSEYWFNLFWSPWTKDKNISRK